MPESTKGKPYEDEKTTMKPREDYDGMGECMNTDISGQERLGSFFGKKKDGGYGRNDESKQA